MTGSPGNTRYPGPLALGDQGRGVFVDRLEQTAWVSEGLLPGNAYRELSIGQASGGAIGMRHLRSTAPIDGPTGWHWHDMDAHLVFVLKGSITFRFQGQADPVVLRPGDCITQPAGVPHNVIDRSADLELLELTLPQRYSTMELDKR